MLETIAKQARAASKTLARTSSEKKNECIAKIAELLDANQKAVLEANAKDIAAAKANGMAENLVDRLMLSQARLNGIAADLRSVVNLPDPIGETFDVFDHPNGLKMHKQRVPLGVIAVIYEARPNVTMDVASLTLKTGNAVILRGGKETIHSNLALVNIIQLGLKESGLPAESVQFIDNPDRKLVSELLKMYEWIDMLIPRGGAGLHKYCRENSSIPVITGGIGICHLYADASAKFDQSVAIVQNAKVQRPSVCNALDTLLVHQAIAAEFLPAVIKRLSQNGVTFRAAPDAMQYLSDADPAVVLPAEKDDFDTEWLSLVLGLKVVDTLDEAIDFIDEHSTHHSDGILTDTEANANQFLAQMDSAAVYVNASTRFTDGSQFGLGAEVAISTQRLHARGPMALKELTTYKWVILGEYHVRP
ncbi:MAG: glutamate-5-semialdehyde dehydrogenase [Anaerolineaceae bacterium]|nr:glutamate-5-semialdehyde dehydrogenase [Anaerolineaceae bacterium]